MIVVSNPNVETSDSKVYHEEETPDIELMGLNIRQKTVYADDRFTWMDLYARKGRNVEAPGGAHRLSDVRVKVVIKDIEPATHQEDISDPSQKLDIAWYLIEADTGTYSLSTQNIFLEGNVNVYGYSLDGTLTEWISGDRLLYDCENGQVRSIGSAIFAGQSSRYRPRRGVITAGLDLSIAEIVVDSTPGEMRDYRTPLQHPELRPIYDPPEALLFLRTGLPENQSPR